MDYIYDSLGRMKFSSDIHVNQGTAWTITDQNHLIKFYEITGPAQLSFDLGRTIGTIMDKAFQLRKKGLMNKRETTKKFKRYDI